MRIGALFAGYGGLDLAVHEVLGGTPAWFSEIDRAPSRILAHHWPDAPNLGDITAIDWTTVEPVDVLTGGFPCQDVSTAGLRRGLKPGTRSGLWAHFAAAIDALRPPLVVIENVRGLLSAEAHSVVEPDPWDLGASGGPDRPALRALGAVLGDLAELGYDARWLGLRAADAGAPHGRMRIFVIARPAADTGSEAERLGARLRASIEGGLGGRRPHDDRASAPAADAADSGRERARESERGREPDADGSGDRLPAGGHRAARLGTGVAAADAAGSGWDGRGTDGIRGARDAAPRSGPADHPPTGRRPAPAADTDGRGCPLGEEQHRDAAPDPTDRDSLRRHPDGCRRAAAADAVVLRADPAPDAGRDEPERRGGPRPVDATPEEAPCTRDPQHDAPRAGSGEARDWGPYRAAVDRWERTLGRLAPAPTERGPQGAYRLNPAFVEWMMGLPAGHVTDPAIGLTRNEQLKALGNGVVPQQAALALRTLLAEDLQ